MYTHLSTLNPSRSDVEVAFDETAHRYTVRGSTRNYTSVTTMLSRYWQPFDGPAIVARYGHRWRTDRTHKYYGMTEEEILQEWEHNRVRASSAGTVMHDLIERYYNTHPLIALQLDVDVAREAVRVRLTNRDPVREVYAEDMRNAASAEMAQFRRFDAHIKPCVWRTELRVYSAGDERVAGSVDMLARDERGAFSMYDWKRLHKHLVDCGHRHDGTPRSAREARACRVCWGRRCREPLSHLPDTPFVHYAMQQSVYAHLLRAYHDVDVRRMHLVQLTPEREDYAVIRVPELRREVAAVLADRRQRLARKRRVKGCFASVGRLLVRLRRARWSDQAAKRRKLTDV
ncbi:hypothetical protein CYMTET_48686 [Cymbomonas tetramitiformis]|uniref:PD-(D/E)XK endonuclease-like domain-containing protein n=1 Tax=Cymbomonas tetramitiformis TaxID=36881 RepID=A0AAE0EWJ8_9CHLO|nr:hypothetical protein CYMTET_48686 [Cymbomonas tetramitiformis]|eukprot:gene4581-5613_t